MSNSCSFLSPPLRILGSTKKTCEREGWCCPGLVSPVLWLYSLRVEFPYHFDHLHISKCAWGFLCAKSQCDWEIGNGGRCNGVGSVTDESFLVVRWLYSLRTDFSYHFVHLHNFQREQSFFVGWNQAKQKMCREISNTTKGRRQWSSISTG